MFFCGSASDQRVGGMRARCTECCICNIEASDPKFDRIALIVNSCTYSRAANGQVLQVPFADPAGYHPLSLFVIPKLMTSHPLYTGGYQTTVFFFSLTGL